MLKNLIRNLFQKLLGFDRYLFFFSHINILRVQWRLSEKAFRYFVEIIDNDGAILDIGANIGIMTVILARTKPAATIYAFEPIPANRKTLERVVGAYGLKNVQIFANALGDTKGTVQMVMPFTGPAKMQGLSHVIETGQSATGEIFRVPIQPLDEIQEITALPKISAIKIDVENFEYFVLRGGRALLAKHRPVVLCELWNNERRDLCFALMRELGYQIKWYNGTDLIDFSGQKKVLDFFFLP